jgi:deoxyribodipyrimidine photo-lyase
MKTLCWIRRDLRLHDHAALSCALSQGEAHIVFIFDSHILDKLKDKRDRRITFIHQSLVEMEKLLQKRGSSLHVLFGKPEDEIPRLARSLEVSAVYANRDYEPYAKERDQKVQKRLKALEISFEQFKDSVIFEKREVLTNSGGLYKIFTPYQNKWLETFEKTGKAISHFECPLSKLAKFNNPQSILKKNWFQEIGFQENPPILKGGSKAALRRLDNFSQKIDNYQETRDYPMLEGTSGLSPYLRFGNISVRDMLRAAISSSSKGAKVWLSEIIWRDFYQVILDAFPHVTKGSFKREYDQIKYIGKAEHFKVWCQGQTGFPLVDAAMRCLNETGLIHNRLRMVVASFLTKILLVDWRVGEAYFAEKLLDFDLAANNGGWQWSSSSGCDAQPYFRIFNPYSQSEKFDREGEFIRKWVPELEKLNQKEIHRPDTLLNPQYPVPIVSYEANRLRCLDMYAIVKKT